VITLRGYQLDIAVQMPPELKNTGIRGLLGNYNDDDSDDLVSSSGQTVDPSSNEETIYYNFGETCESTIIITTGQRNSSRQKAASHFVPLLRIG